MRSRNAIAVTLVLCAGLAGCTRDDDPTPSTTTSISTTATAAPSTPSTSSPSVDELVLAAYRAFYAALTQARKDPTRAREILAPVATGEQYKQTTEKLISLNDAGIEEYGETKLNEPVVAKLDETSAEVHDCQDTSQVGNRKRVTGEVLQHGASKDSATTTLVWVDGSWKVSSTTSPDDWEAYC